jgi:hypothetical protein
VPSGDLPPSQTGAPPQPSQATTRTVLRSGRGAHCIFCQKTADFGGRQRVYRLLASCEGRAEQSSALVGDWCHRRPSLRTALALHGRSGVFAQSGGKQLREVRSLQQLLAALPENAADRLGSARIVRSRLLLHAPPLQRRQQRGNDAVLHGVHAEVCGQALKKDLTPTRRALLSEQKASESSFSLCMLLEKRLPEKRMPSWLFARCVAKTDRVRELAQEHGRRAFRLYIVA